MSEEPKTKMSAEEVEVIENATNRIKGVLSASEHSEIRPDAELSSIYSALNSLIVLGQSARGFRNLEITMLTRPGFYNAGTSIEKPVKKEIEKLKISSAAIASKKPSYQTDLFKCLADFEDCCNSSINNIVCGFLFAACVAERLIPLAGGQKK